MEIAGLWELTGEYAAGRTQTWNDPFYRCELDLVWLGFEIPTEAFKVFFEAEKLPIKPILTLSGGWTVYIFTV